MPWHASIVHGFLLISDARLELSIPAIAQLAEHLTVEACRYQMVPGSIPGRRIIVTGAWEL